MRNYFTLLPVFGIVLSSCFGQSNVGKEKTRVTVEEIAALPSNVLYVINDSIAGTNKDIFDKIKTSDIRSIKKITDPGATAVYGTRGSNGVVLISTFVPITDKVKISK